MGLGVGQPFGQGRFQGLELPEPTPHLRQALGQGLPHVAAGGMALLHGAEDPGDVLKLKPRRLGLLDEAEAAEGLLPVEAKPPGERPLGARSPSLS